MLADDHAMVREGIKKLVHQNPELTVIDEAGDALDLLHLLEESTPDMVILDISMPRLPGLEPIKLIKGLHPEVKVLILTMHKSKDYLYEAMGNGADGYILKEDARDARLNSISIIRRGKTFISPSLFG